jgi:hypothetical protein
MAKVILGSDEYFPIASEAQAMIYGTNDGDETVAIQVGADVEFDSSFNRGGDSIQILADSRNYDIYREGANVYLIDDEGTEIKIPVGVQGIDIEFSDQSYYLRIEEGQVKFADLVVTFDPQPISQQVEASADIGTGASPATLDAVGEDFLFTDDADIENFVSISNFDDGDSIQVTNAEVGDYNFSNDGVDVDITYNNTDAGVLNEMTLVGVVDSISLVYDEASFETAIGFDAFAYV